VFTRKAGKPISVEDPRRVGKKRTISVIFGHLQPGEGACAAYFFAYAFLLLVCYYILKTLREPLLLTESSPELKSYAYATVAVILLIVVPAYAAIYRRVRREQIGAWVTLFFIANLMVFYVLGKSQVDIGFVYYVWVGVFGVTILAQFWGHAADAFNVHRGRHLFPLIMTAAATGGLIGTLLVSVLVTALGPWNLMLIATVILSATLPLIRRSRDAVPEPSRNTGGKCDPETCSWLGGFSTVLHSRYLLLLAVLIVLLNCVNTMGEYLLTELVVGAASEQVALDPTADVGAIIGRFYGNYFLLINVLTVLAQLFLVARSFRWLGVHGALLILPVAAIVGYALAAFIPIFAVLRIVKTVENAADYSVMNTSRQALYLPLSVTEKFQGKVTVDTFFYRFGDLLQAGIVFVGIHVFNFSLPHFALLNACLAGIWLVVAVQLGKVRRPGLAHQRTRYGFPKYIGLARAPSE
jgi:AAA family ATP:ADP antiporter